MRKQPRRFRPSLETLEERTVLSTVTSPAANGGYGLGAIIPIAVNFGQPVTVTGSPQLLLNSGGTATYASGSGTNALTFSYTIGAGQFSPDLDYTSATALTLNGGTITDASNAAVNLTLPIPGAAGSLETSSNLVVETSLATVTQTTPNVSSGTLTAGSIALQVQFSEPVLGAGLAGNYQLQSAGPDGLLGTADDVIVPLTASYSGTTATVTFAPLAAGSYRLTVKDNITDALGNKLDGDSNGVASGNFTCDFGAVNGGVSNVVGTVGSDGPSSTPTQLTPAGDNLFFLANNGPTTSLWVTGPSGTTQLTNNLGISTQYGFTVNNNILYFFATSSAGTGLYRSGGTLASTTLVSKIVNSFPSEAPTVFEGDLYFSINGSLYRSDGTSSGTSTVFAGGSNAYIPGPLTVFNGKLYFTPVVNNDYQLLSTDGTTAGTTLVQDFGTAYPSIETVFNNKLYYVSDSYSNGSASLTLYATTGTANGSTALQTIAGAGYISSLKATSGAIFYRAKQFMGHRWNGCRD